MKGSKQFLQTENLACVTALNRYNRDRSGPVDRLWSTPEHGLAIWPTQNTFRESQAISGQGPSPAGSHLRGRTALLGSTSGYILSSQTL